MFLNSTNTTNTTNATDTSCYKDADYISIIREYAGEQLLVNQTLASSNCRHMLRAYSHQFCLSSYYWAYIPGVGGQFMLTNPYVNCLSYNDSIWSIYPSNSTYNHSRAVHLSDEGCLQLNVHPRHTTGFTLREYFCELVARPDPTEYYTTSTAAASSTTGHMQPPLSTTTTPTMRPSLPPIPSFKFPSRRTHAPSSMPSVYITTPMDTTFDQAASDSSNTANAYRVPEAWIIIGICLFAALLIFILLGAFLCVQNRNKRYKAVPRKESEKAGRDTQLDMGQMNESSGFGADYIAAMGTKKKKFHGEKDGRVDPDARQHLNVPYTNTVADEPSELSDISI